MKIFFLGFSNIEEVERKITIHEFCGFVKVLLKILFSWFFAPLKFDNKNHQLILNFPYYKSFTMFY